MFCQFYLPTVFFFNIFQNLKDYWFPIVLCKTAAEKNVDGGLGTITSAAMVEAFFKGGPVFEIIVYGPGGATLALRGTYYGTIADESAEASMATAKGASGNKTCMKCENCVRPGLGLDGIGRFVSWDCCDGAKLAPHTKEGVASIYDHFKQVAAEPRSKTRLEKLEKASGFTWHPRSVWAVPALRGTSGPTQKHLHNNNKRCQCFRNYIMLLVVSLVLLSFWGWVRAGPLGRGWRARGALSAPEVPDALTTSVACVKRVKKCVKCVNCFHEGLAWGGRPLLIGTPLRPTRTRVG